ncbi:MAG: hypothetical protein JRS35_17700 [Deltaproteobacteria bacterium]|nr:hypothetical protein [Deltaproteobacteria bacterium]
MKRTSTFLVGIVLFLGLTLSLACATTPAPPARESPDLSVIGIAVSISAPAGWWHNQATHVYFVRLDDPDHYAQDDPIRSNYTRGKYVYLFNARPGRYAVVAAGYETQGQGAPMGGSFGVGGGVSVGVSMTPTYNNTFTAYFPRTLVDKTAVTVDQGEMAFMGEISLDKTDWEAADDVQLHYYRLLAPGHKDLNFLMKAFSGQRHDAGIEHELDQDQATRRRFLEHSQHALTDTWEDVVLNPVGSGPPAR